MAGSVESSKRGFVALLRVGIVGLGVGEQHISGFNAHSNCQVTTLCDFDAEKLSAVAERHPNCKTVSAAESILTSPDIDIVSIASYDSYHADQIVTAIDNGKHVFVEKPLCLYPHEAQRIRSALDKSPELLLSSNLILRKSPRLIELKQNIDDDVYGEIFYVEGDYNYGRLHKLTDGWRGRIDYYSVVYGGGVHIVDLLMWLTGDTVRKVAAFGNRIAAKDTAFRHNDLVAGILEFESGMVAKVSCNFGCVEPHFHRFSIYGTEGTFHNRRGNGERYVSRDPGQAAVPVTSEYPGYHKGDMIPSFVDAILGCGEAEIGVEDVFRTMSVCFAIEKSVAESKTITVEYY